MLAIVDVDSQSDQSAGGEAVRHVAHIAESVGLRMYRVPRDFEAVGGPDNALWQVPKFDHRTDAVWVGFMIETDAYQATYDALAKRNIYLINNPTEHVRSEEFDAWYPVLRDLTSESAVVRSGDEAVLSAQAIGYPVFLKGTVQSLKVEGIGSCVASNDDEVRTLAARLLAHSSRTRGRVIVRAVMPLRYETVGPTGMPVGREFRVFVLDGQVVDTGYYWPFADPLSALSSDDRIRVERLAIKVQKQVAVPWLAVDIGQLQDGSWEMIEIGDAQFAGLCGASPFKVFDTLRARTTVGI